MNKDFEKDAREEAEARWPPYLSFAPTAKELSRLNSFTAGAIWAAERMADKKLVEGRTLYGRAETISLTAGISFQQIARALSLSSTRNLYSSSLAPSYQKRFDEFEALIENLPGKTAVERKANLLNSASGPSLFMKFCSETSTHVQIQSLIPLRERLGLDD